MAGYSFFSSSRPDQCAPGVVAGLYPRCPHKSIAEHGVQQRCPAASAPSKGAARMALSLGFLYFGPPGPLTWLGESTVPRCWQAPGRGVGLGWVKQIWAGGSMLHLNRVWEPSAEASLAQEVGEPVANHRGQNALRQRLC